MDLTQLGSKADTNLASTWAQLGRLIGADVVEGSPLTLVSTGIPIAFFNGAYVSAPDDDPAALIAAAVGFFSDRQLPWLLWVREGVAPAVLDAGRAAGLSDAGGPPAMGMYPVPAPPDPPPGLTVELVVDEVGLRDHGAMLQQGFDMPREVVDSLLNGRLYGQERIAAFVGRVDGEPVSSSLLCISADTAGVYNVATPERFRGRGYGEALTWAAVAEGTRRGCSNAVLQASAAGYPIYRRMGFVDLGKYVQLAGPVTG